MKEILKLHRPSHLYFHPTMVRNLVVSRAIRVKKCLILEIDFNSPFLLDDH
jgi:hypothetical protein